jgi:hypothetical protein
MILAFLLELKEREPRILYGDQVFAAGVMCLLVPLVSWLIGRVRKKKKSQRASYWLWVFVGSGIAMLVLGYLLEVQNPGLRPGDGGAFH